MISRRLALPGSRVRVGRRRLLRRLKVIGHAACNSSIVPPAQRRAGCLIRRHRGSCRVRLRQVKPLVGVDHPGCLAGGTTDVLPGQPRCGAGTVNGGQCAIRHWAADELRA